MYTQYEAFCAHVLNSYKKPNTIHRHEVWQQIDIESHDIVETLLTITMNLKLDDVDIKALFMVRSLILLLY